jgi:FAD/FMN-containing dehydrogenase
MRTSLALTLAGMLTASVLLVSHFAVLFPPLPQDVAPTVVASIESTVPVSPMGPGYNPAPPVIPVS